jgi:small multidrug resistance family-3 protein
MSIIKSLSFFVLAGFCEIGGGYLIWVWLKNNKPWWYGLLGAIILIFYGVMATLQTSDFGRVYAAYGGVFIGMSLLWAWKFDSFTPDKYDIIGAIIALLGVCLIIYAPRN